MTLLTLRWSRMNHRDRRVTFMAIHAAIKIALIASIKAFLLMKFIYSTNVATRSSPIFVLNWNSRSLLQCMSFNTFFYFFNFPTFDTEVILTLITPKESILLIKSFISTFFANYGLVHKLFFYLFSI